MRLRDRFYGRKPDDETAPPQAEESAPIAGLNPVYKESFNPCRGWCPNH